MKYTLSDKIIAYLTLFSGLTISAVAIWYSVAGLVSIFAAAVIPIVVMGVVLEVSKLIATVWLKLNWNRAPVFIRTYLLIAIAVLMVITSMGIFGFLSKAHSDAGLVSGDVQAKIAVYDEKIKTERENIDAARKALTQMDAQVNERLSRSTDDRGAERAVQIRRQQQAERTRLQNDISRSQGAIAKLNEERAPIAAEVRKVEAEVGPIKYIASFIYGSNPDANLLEKAVTWVIIIIVAVFDPLAVILLLASQYSFQWFRRAQEEETTEGDSPISSVSDDAPTVTESTEGDSPEKESDVVSTATVTEPPAEFKLDSKTVETQSWSFDKPSTEIEIPVLENEELWTQRVIDEEDEISDTLSAAEKVAMHKWKDEHPGESLKYQRRLLEKGLIKNLPWLEPVEEVETAKNSVEWIENVEGRQVKKQLVEGYVQNAEQDNETLWQRVHNAKSNK